MKITTLLLFGAVFVAIYLIYTFWQKRKPRILNKQTIQTKRNQEQNNSSGFIQEHHASVPGLKPPPENFIDNLVSVPARIYDNRTRTVYNADLPAADVRQIRRDFGNLGRMWFYNNEWRYAIVRKNDSTCEPIQRFMASSLNNPPERLHRALQQEETESYYNPRDNRGILAKYGAYLLFAGIAIGVLFLWGANIMR